MDLQLLFDQLSTVLRDIITFIPRLINGLIILIVGYLIAATARWLLGFILRRLGFDTLMDELGLAAVLRSIGIKTPLSRIAAQLTFVLLFISFLTTAMRLIGLEAVAVVLDQLLTYLPSLIAALVVFLIGSLVARFVGDMVTTVATGADMGYARRLGRTVHYLLTLFIVVLALGTLGVETAVLITAITIMLAAFGLALGLGLGLSVRHVLYQILAGYYTRQHFPVGRSITVNDVSGTVSSIGSTRSEITTADEVLVIPHTILFETVVRASLPARAEGETATGEQPSV
jgi:small-conductance mechanosensitive channel